MNYTVYCYVFDDGMTYIGLTRGRPLERHWLHRSRKKHKNGQLKSAVHRYKEKSGLPFPDMFVLEDGLTKAEAQRYEDIYVTSIDPSMRLNVGKTGVGVGSIGLPENGERLSDAEKKAKKSANNKKYHRQHREEIRKRKAVTRRKWYLKNRERLKAYSSAYYKSHPDVVAAYLERNKERLRAYRYEYNRAYRQKRKKSPPTEIKVEGEKGV